MQMHMRTIRLVALFLILFLASEVAAEKMYVLFTIDVESTSHGNPDCDIWRKCRAIKIQKENEIIESFQV